MKKLIWLMVKVVALTFSLAMVCAGVLRLLDMWRDLRVTMSTDFFDYVAIGLGLTSLGMSGMIMLLMLAITLYEGHA